MKSISRNFLRAGVLIMILSLGLSMAVKPKTENVTIQTSAICDSCKKRIEKAVKALEGVLNANLNLGDKKIKVKYDPALVSPDQVRNAIAEIGYDADYVKKNGQSFNNLPACCQKP